MHIAVCRAIYVPLVRTTMNRKYLLHENAVDLDEETPFYSEDVLDKRCRAIVLLYDWYRYLSEYTDELKSGLDKYEAFMQEEVDLTSYFDRPIASEEAANGNYIVKKDRDKFSCGSLYDMTKSISSLVSLDGKFKDNMRYNSRIENTGPDAADGPKEIRDYHYELFLNATREADEQYQRDCQAMSTKILALYTDPYCRTDCMINDYQYGTPDNNKHIIELVDKSLTQNYLFYDDTQRILFNQWVTKAAFVDQDEILSGPEAQFYDKPIAQIHDIIKGEPHPFVKIISPGTAGVALDSMLRILDILLQNCKVMDSGVYDLVSRNIIKRYVATLDIKIDTIIKTSDIKSAGWYAELGPLFKSGNIETKPAGSVIVDTDWFSHYRARTGYTVLDYADAPEVRIVKIESDELVFVAESKTYKLDHLKNNLNTAREALEQIGFILNGYNLLKNFKDYQLSTESESGEFLLAMTGSFFSLTENLFKSVLTKALTPVARSGFLQIGGKLAKPGMVAGKITGVLGVLVSCVEMYTKRSRTAAANDNNASYLYTVSLVFNILWGVTLLIPGFQWISLFFMLGGIAVSLAAAHYEDEAIDTFLKYTLWGSHYGNEMFTVQESSKVLPSWWPGALINPEAHTIVLDKYMKTSSFDALKPFYVKDDIQDTLKPGEIILERHGILLNILSQVMLVSNYELELGNEQVLFENHYFDTLVIQFSPLGKSKDPDFETIRSLRMSVFQTDKAKMFWNTMDNFLKSEDGKLEQLSPNTIRPGHIGPVIQLNLDNERDIKRYLKSGNGQYAISDIESAVCFSAALIGDVSEACRSFRDFSGYMQREWPFYRVVRKLDNTKVKKVIIRVEFKEEASLFPVEFAGYKS
jgi:hypothetical protein